MNPRISVIVPSRGRLVQLGRLLDCLAGQRGVEPGAYEVVVGLDGHTPAEAAALPTDFAFAVKYLPLAASGISAAKNAAVAAARGEVLLFVNDDVEPEAGFVAAHLAAQDAGDEVVLGASPFVRWPDQTVFDELVARTRMIFFYGDLTDGERYDFRHAWNLNLGVHRRLIEKLAMANGPFSDRLRPVFYDDVEFAHRLIGSAKAVRYRAAARAPHRHRYDLPGYFEREALLGIMSSALAELNRSCHEAIFGEGPDELLARARRGLSLDVPDGRRLLAEFIRVAGQPWSDDLPAGHCEALYAMHLPLKRRAFRCGLAAGAEQLEAPWTHRHQLAVGALRGDPVFSQSVHWSGAAPNAARKAAPDAAPDAATQITPLTGPSTPRPVRVSAIPTR